MGKENPNIQWDRIFYGRKLMEQIITTIETKDILKGVYFKRYFFRAMMAGFIIAIMTVLTLKVKAEFAAEINPGVAGLISGILFSFALVFILFTNSELLTSNFMYFTVGMYYRKISVWKVINIFLLCFIGNITGGIVLFLLMKGSTVMSPEMQTVLMSIVDKKSSISAGDIFIRAIFANFFINISVVIAMQLSETMPKMFIMMTGVSIFAYMGYEHVVANTAFFIGALLYHPEQVDMLNLLKNIVFSFFGNYVGGGLIIGLFYAYLNDHRKLDMYKNKLKL